MTTSRLKTGRPNANCTLWNASSVEFRTRLETIHTKLSLYATQRFRPRPRCPCTTAWKIADQALPKPSYGGSTYPRATSPAVSCVTDSPKHIGVFSRGPMQPHCCIWQLRAEAAELVDSVLDKGRLGNRRDERAQLGPASAPHAMARSLVARRLFAMLVPPRLPSQSCCSLAPLEMEATWLLASVGRRWLEV